MELVNTHIHVKRVNVVSFHVEWSYFKANGNSFESISSQNLTETVKSTNVLLIWYSDPFLWLKLLVIATFWCFIRNTDSSDGV